MMIICLSGNCVSLALWNLSGLGLRQACGSGRKQGPLQAKLLSHWTLDCESPRVCTVLSRAQSSASFQCVIRCPSGGKRAEWLGAAKISELPSCLGAADYCSWARAQLIYKLSVHTRPPLGTGKHDLLSIGSTVLWLLLCRYVVKQVVLYSCSIFSGQLLNFYFFIFFLLLGPLWEFNWIQ